MGLTKDLGALPRAITVSGNNVGINTTPNASFMLDVNGTGRFSGNVRLSNSSNSGSGNDFPRFTIANTLATQGNGTSTYNFSDINISSGNGAVNMFIATTFAAGTWAPSGMINVSTNHDFQIRTNGTERMRIFASGNVFIGPSPVDAGNRLDINGNLRVTTNGTFGTSKISNGAGLSVVEIYGSSNFGSTPAAELRLYHIWNGLSYPVILASAYDPTSGPASSSFTISTTTFSGSPITTERMRIVGTSGNVGIGTTNPTHLLHLMLPAGQNGQILRLSRSAGSYTWGLGTNSSTSSLDFHNDGGTVVANINFSTGVYTPLSDKRLKENIVDSGEALQKLLKIKVRKYNWKNSDIKEDFGLIAQELNEVLPQYVQEGNEETNWGVAKAELVPLLIKAIQELTARLEILENK